MTVRDVFNDLAGKWREETAGLSSIQSIVHNRWYQQIIGLGPAAVPLILEDLRDGPGGYWFWALTAITREDPAKGTTRYSDARMAWLDHHTAAPRAERLHPDYIDGVAFVNRAARIALDGRISIDGLRSIFYEMRDEYGMRDET